MLLRPLLQLRGPATAPLQPPRVALALPAPGSAAAPQQQLQQQRVLACTLTSQLLPWAPHIGPAPPHMEAAWPGQQCAAQGAGG